MNLLGKLLDDEIKEKIKNKTAVHSSLELIFLDNYKNDGNKKNYDEYSMNTL